MAESAVGDLPRVVAAAARQAADLALPPPMLDGWSSLTAGEYAAAVLRLGGLLADVRGGIVAAGLLIPPP
jgi:hypothetical protein